MRLRNFQSSQVSLSTCPLYTHHCHMVLSKQKCLLLLTSVSTESKTYLCASDKAGILATRSMTRINVGLAQSYVKLFLFVKNIYVQFEGTVYQHIVRIPIGSKCAPVKAVCFLFCYERNFMSNLHNSKQYDLIDIFKHTSRYLDHIFTIINTE